MPVRSHALSVVGRATTDIRSGRFKGDASGGIPIIAARGKGGAYRIFNSGNKTSSPAFEVHAGDGSIGALQPGCSLDVLIAGSAAVKIQHSDTTEVVGSYEYLQRPTSFRSGRFTGNASGAGIPIVLGCKNRNKMYRIFNSGKNTFNVHVGAWTSPLGPTFSLDVVADSNVVIKMDGEVEGIYEYLGAELPVRSGRFKIRESSTSNHKIIALGSSAPAAYYRIFNSGDHEFNLQLVGETRPIQTIKPDQSFDFTVGRDQEITVAATVAATGDRAIEGIYDLLGIEE